MFDFVISSSSMILIYGVTLVILITRYKSPYILRRSPIMLCISLIGNFFQSLIYLSQLMELSKDFDKSSENQCFMLYRIRQSGNLFFHYLMFFPSILRAYRLHLIFKVDQTWEIQNFSFTKYTYRTKQIWMIWALILMMIPFLVLAIIILNYCRFALYLWV